MGAGGGALLGGLIGGLGSALTYGGGKLWHHMQNATVKVVENSKSVNRSCAKIAGLFDKVDPNTASVMRSLGESFEEYIRSVVEDDQDIDLTGNPFADDKQMARFNKQNPTTASSKFKIITSQETVNNPQSNDGGRFFNNKVWKANVPVVGPMDEHDVYDWAATNTGSQVGEEVAERGLGRWWAALLARNGGNASAETILQQAGHSLSNPSNWAKNVGKSAAGAGVGIAVDMGLNMGIEALRDWASGAEGVFNQEMEDVQASIQDILNDTQNNPLIQVRANALLESLNRAKSILYQVKQQSSMRNSSRSTKFIKLV